MYSSLRLGVVAGRYSNLKWPCALVPDSTHDHNREANRKRKLFRNGVYWGRSLPTAHALCCSVCDKTSGLQFFQLRCSIYQRPSQVHDPNDPDRPKIRTETDQNRKVQDNLFALLHSHDAGRECDISVT
jgi:hypothetical protein